MIAEPSRDGERVVAEPCARSMWAPGLARVLDTVNSADLTGAFRARAPNATWGVARILLDAACS